MKYIFLIIGIVCSFQSFADIPKEATSLRISAFVPEDSGIDLFVIRGTISIRTSSSRNSTLFLTNLKAYSNENNVWFKVSFKSRNGKLTGANTPILMNLRGDPLSYKLKFGDMTFNKDSGVLMFGKNGLPQENKLAIFTGDNLITDTGLWDDLALSLTVE